MGWPVVWFLLFHFLGMAVYMVVVDEKYCQGDYADRRINECYDWKGAAGIWEVVLLQELVIRPALKETP